MRKAKLVSLFPLAVLLSLPGCGPAKRHPMVQKEIDQCVAGLASLMPDANARKKACECVAEARQADQVYSGTRDAAYEEAHAAKIEACGASGFASNDDPFGILGKPSPADVSAAPVDNAEALERESEAGEAMDGSSPEAERSTAEGI